LQLISATSDATIDVFQIYKNGSEVELKLIQAEIELIDSLVEKGINELNWNSESN